MDVQNYEQKYLGDGVYSSFDGYQLWLAVNHHENLVLALEPVTFLSLIQAAGDYWDKAKLAEMLRSEADRIDPKEDDE